MERGGRTGTPKKHPATSVRAALRCDANGMSSKSNLKAAANRSEYGGQIVHARIALWREHAMQALAGCSGYFRQLLEAERRIYEVAKNDARRFRFVAQEQRCSLVEERFGECRISLNPSHYGFLEITSECHVD